MPTYDRAFLDALEKLPTREWRGRVWRHMFNQYAPERINTGGARWNPPGVGAIYAALERETAIAEGEHMIEVQPRRIFRRRVLYELAVEVNQVVDLTDPADLGAVGLTMADVASDNFTACQRVGGAIEWLGHGGIPAHAGFLPQAPPTPANPNGGGAEVHEKRCAGTSAR